MTTISIERALLERALEALGFPVFKTAQMLVKRDEAIKALRAALAAPATAPEPICTKCGDVITAHDPGLCGCCLSTRDATSPERTICQTAYSVGSTRCLMLFNALAQADAACGVSPGAMGSAAG